MRQERRKARLLNKLKDKNSDEMNEKIAREEWKILKAQRMLESIRLIEALFRRIKVTIDFIYLSIYLIMNVLFFKYCLFISNITDLQFIKLRLMCHKNLISLKCKLLRVLWKNDPIHVFYALIIIAVMFNLN